MTASHASQSPGLEHLTGLTDSRAEADFIGPYLAEGRFPADSRLISTNLYRSLSRL